MEELEVFTDKFFFRFNFCFFVFFFFFFFYLVKHEVTIAFCLAFVVFNHDQKKKKKINCLLGL